MPKGENPFVFSVVAKKWYSCGGRLRKCIQFLPTFASEISFLSNKLSVKVRMELIVTVTGVKPMVEREFTKQDGTKAVIKSKEIQLSTGIDQLVAEANDALAEHLERFQPSANTMYAAQLALTVQESRKADQGGRLFTSIRLKRLVEFIKDKPF